MRVYKNNGTLLHDAISISILFISPAPLVIIQRGGFGELCCTRRGTKPPFALSYILSRAGGVGSPTNHPGLQAVIIQRVGLVSSVAPDVEQKISQDELQHYAPHSGFCLLIH